jgi:hypothetical protein
VAPSLSSADRKVLVGILAAALFARLIVIANLNINWDEFYYLSLVHDHLRGNLDLTIQTFHVHFFGWLPRVAINEVDQVIAARGLMLGFHLATVLLLYRIGRRVAGSHAGLFAATAYLSVSLVIRNGTSFRSDTLALPFVMAAFDLLLTQRASSWRPALAGLLLAVAAMITIKTAIFLPTLAVLLGAPLVAGQITRDVARRAVPTVLAATVAFALLQGLHGQSVGSSTIRSTAAVTAASLSTTVAETSLLPQRDTLVATLVWDAPFWALCLVGCGILIRRIRGTSGSRRASWVEVAALALPVASIAVYRNSFPYFYPTILAPASILLAVAWQRITERVVMVTLSWFAASVLVHGVYVPMTMPLEHQRTVLAMVHRMFPKPVPYLDRSSALASFPQVGFFMSTWGLDAYLKRGQPLLLEAIEERSPPLLIANHPLLNLEQMIYPASSKDSLYLLPEDREALAGAYIHYWGPVYVAGKRLTASSSQSTGPMHFDLLIPGRYTLEANGPVHIDGHPVVPGQSIDLIRGVHRGTVLQGSEPAALRWGEGLYRPAQAPPRAEFFLGF